MALTNAKNVSIGSPTCGWSPVRSSMTITVPSGVTAARAAASAWTGRQISTGSLAGVPSMLASMPSKAVNGPGVA